MTAQHDYLLTAVAAAKRAGKMIIENLGHLSGEDVRRKQLADFVTRVDNESELSIINTIKGSYPDHFILAEESVKDSRAETYRWIIDPLDGTTNYIHRFPVFSVSIALQFRHEIMLGVTYDPVRNELFTAEKGKGFFANQLKIHMASSTNLGDSLIATGFPFRKKNLIDPYLKLFKNIFMKVSDLRRAGSAALDLAYLASGRCDGFFEIGLSPWDIAAGEIMIKEAGGIITDFNGGHEHLLTGNVVAGVPSVHDLLLQEIKKVFAGIIDK
jgi:myo-inositol-1(or 4)-monophosphatase